MEVVRIYIQEQGKRDNEGYRRHAGRSRNRENAITKAIDVMRAEERRLTPPKQLALL